MSKLATTLVSLVVVASIVTPVAAQVEGDFRTRDSGDWSMAQIWERYNGSAWAAFGTPPTGSETITILESDSVFVDAATTITGHLVNQGIVEVDDESGFLTVEDGGVYQHDHDIGEIPTTTWAEGSTLLMTGVETFAPENRNQNYHNVTFNTPDLLANLNMALDSVTVAGDIHVIGTGLARWYLTSAEPTDSSTITLMGDVIVDEGTFSVQGTSNALTKFVVHHYGNVDVTGGNFSISRGSQGNGTTTWYLYEGDFSMSDATTQNSTSTPDGARFVFASAGTQTLTLENVEVLALPIEVSDSTTLDMGTSTLAGAGFFLLNEGGTLATAAPGGISEIFADVVATVTLDDNASFGFNGTETQVTSEQMPTVVNDLTINNSAGVTLSQETTINGVLRLQAGVFDNTIPFTLGPQGSISEEGGSLAVPVSVEEEDGLTQAFAVEQNYPNPFRSSTVIRYALPSASEVSLTVFNLLGQTIRRWEGGRLPAGSHEFTFEGAGLSGGLYIYRVEAGDFVAARQMVLLE